MLSCPIAVSKEQSLRAEVGETIRSAQLDHIDWSTIPPAGSEVARALERLGHLLNGITAPSDVTATTRAELLARLIDAGLPPDARFGGRRVNGLDVTPDGSNRSSLLMLCVRRRFAEGMDVLIELGADVRAASADYGYTILDQAIEHLDLACARRALDAAPYAAYSGGPSLTLGVIFANSATALWADPQRVEDILGLLLERGMPRAGLLSTVVKRGRDCAWIVDVLIKHGCDPREEKNAPAIAAAQGGKVAILARLFEHGVDPDLKGERGASLMRFRAKHVEIKSLVRACRAQRAAASALGVGEVCRTAGRSPSGPI